MVSVSAPGTAMDPRPGGNAASMVPRILGLLALTAPLVAGCVVSRDSLGSSHDDEDDGTSAPLDEGSSGESEDSEGGTAFPPLHAPQCDGIDHESCYVQVVQACLAKDTGQACTNALAECYPFGPPALFARDLHDLCQAEVDESCLGEAPEPECGPSYCDCIAGAYPFDWTNCFHLTASACIWQSDSDCEAAVSQCYPGATIDEYLACAEQRDQELCDCPRCGHHVQCEEALAACLQG